MFTVRTDLSGGNGPFHTKTYDKDQTLETL